MSKLYFDIIKLFRDTIIWFDTSGKLLLFLNTAMFYYSNAIIVFISDIFMASIEKNVNCNLL